MDDFGFVTQEEENKDNFPNWTKSNLKKTQTIKKIVSSGRLNFLFWKKPNKLEFYQKEKKKRKYQLPKNETIKDIASGHVTYLILSESGKVWSLSAKNHFVEVPFLDVDQSTFEEIRPVTFFEEKKLFVNSVMMGYVSGYYLCNGDQLYASGSNAHGRLGIGKTQGKEPMPVYVQDKVIKIFAGLSALNFFSPQILTISSGESHSILINNKGQTFGCGHQRKNGLGVQKIIFTLIPQLKEKKAVQLATEFKGNLVLTDQNELYGWGMNKRFYPTDESESNNWKLNIPIPTKINLPSYFTNYLESKDLIRIAIGARFKRTLVECKTKLTIDQIQNKLFGEKSINKEQTLSFLKWIYFDEISDLEKLEQTFNLLELTFPPSVDNTLEKDIAQLYKDDDSKDFKILVKIEDNNQDNDNDNDKEYEDEEENYEEIPVHKFILLARSGLFRAMFDYVNEKENTNKIQDYTNKSIKSLKILIKYFYTNSIELTTNQEPKLIVDELSDAVEYYQLNDQCNFESELLKIKNQFDLK
ncbi:hypothetical protein M0812_28464 [Anaeramoeba flamelloides]|uniref:BTB domain-containing protein n=1 Tax=Anaeramoeba flamelloides TaxID=1746091 RepID=A0AAV7YDL9_9EUKA|nr:hypothetical protein M0812_28464 [Anaeramoeba flamelloides]